MKIVVPSAASSAKSLRSSSILRVSGCLAPTDRRERVGLLDHDVGEKGVRPAPGAAASGLQHRRQRFLGGGEVPGIGTDRDQQGRFFWVGSGMGGLRG